MAREVTGAYLIRQCRQRADMENTQFVTDADIIEWLNADICELWDALVKADPNFAYDTFTITTVAGTVDYGAAIPADFYQCRGIDRVDLNGRNIPLRPLNDQERIGPLPTSLLTMPRFQIRGVSQGPEGIYVHFDPDPGSHDYIVHYTTVALQIADATTDFDGIQGWEDWPIWATVEKMLIKEKMDTREAQRKLAEVKYRVTDMANNRDAENDIGIAITRPSFRRGTRRFSHDIW